MSQTVTVTLTDFLLARIAEDEAVARAVIAQGEADPDGQWHAREYQEDGLSIRPGLDRDCETTYSGPYEWRTPAVLPSSWVDERCAHIGRWSPARVLAECEAKRRIAEAWQDAERAVATYNHDNPTPAYWQEWGNRHALALAVETLALPYADHPDYRAEWKP